MKVYKDEKRGPKSYYLGVGRMGDEENPFPTKLRRYYKDIVNDGKNLNREGSEMSCAFCVYRESHFVIHNGQCMTYFTCGKQDKTHPPKNCQGKP